MDGQILLLGDHRHREFQSAVAQMESATEVLAFHSVEAAAKWLTSAAGSPRWIVMAQSRPGQFYAADLEALFALSPLSRMVVMLGSWCEGETRSGTPYPGIERVYFHAWDPWFRRQWQAIPQQEVSRQDSQTQSSELQCVPPQSPKEESPRASTWNYLTGTASHLPRTATTNDYFLSESQLAIPQLHAKIGIASANADTVDALRDMLQLADVELIWLDDSPIATNPSDLDLVIAHDVEPRQNQTNSVDHLESMCPGVPKLAMIDFPRWDELKQLDGRTQAVISQPYRIADLIGTICQILGRDLSDTTGVSGTDRKSKSRQAA